MNYSRNNLKHQLMATRFSMWDLHLYLDTHPCDETAVELLERYQEKYRRLLSEYECKYGPLSPESGHGEAWTKAPWPWDKAGDC